MQGALTRPGTWKKGSEKGSSWCVKKGSSWAPASSLPLGAPSESSSELPAWCLPMRLAACLFSLHKSARQHLGLPNPAVSQSGTSSCPLPSSGQAPPGYTTAMLGMT